MFKLCLKSQRLTQKDEKGGRVFLLLLNLKEDKPLLFTLLLNAIFDDTVKLLRHTPALESATWRSVDLFLK